MKKIGILTLPLHKNYGGLLQAYALRKYLCDQGYEAIVLDRQWNMTTLDHVKRGVKKIFFPNRVKKDHKIHKNMSYFIHKYIPKTEALDSEKKLKETVDNLNLDAIVVGSDQVWRLEYTKGFYMNYFFNFLSNNTKIKKLSYAASFGEDTWSHSSEVTTKVSNLLAEFNGISVREDTSIDLCKDHFGMNAMHHVDPTMLLTPEDYIKLMINEKEPQPKDDVLVYMLDINKDRQKTIDAVCNYFKCNYFSVNVKSINVNDALENRIYPTVTSWLKGFKEAKFIVTDSFHGSVFSILFNKPFVAYGNVGRGLSRFKSLFRMFGLENRFILKHSDLDVNFLTEEIDWVNVNNILKGCRSKADSFFENNI